MIIIATYCTDITAHKPLYVLKFHRSSLIFLSSRAHFPSLYSINYLLVSHLSSPSLSDPTDRRIIPLRSEMVSARPTHHRSYRCYSYGIISITLRSGAKLTRRRRVNHETPRALSSTKRQRYPSRK